uniref:Uncharacterized protein n=1 Tax=Nelumbo nucifera TaxID=4432 RepID=A0A822YDD3_NELNU|nr:TPA_asm: hypothetical protein HUJ06_030453 [Nelumbo nucifera]
MPLPTSDNANLTTCLNYTNLGVFSLTWCRNVIGRDLQIDLHFDDQSGFYAVVVVDGVMTLLVDRTKTQKPKRRNQVLISRREHVFGNKVYTMRAIFGGKARDISIDCSVSGDEPWLCFSVDQKRVLQIKRLKWKFKGNERIEVDEVPIQVSCYVYNWLREIYSVVWRRKKMNIVFTLIWYIFKKVNIF